jgi:hypothetical protein
MFMLLCWRTTEVSCIFSSDKHRRPGPQLTLPSYSVGTVGVQRPEREAESSPLYSAFLTYLGIVYLNFHWRNSCLATYFLVQLRCGSYVVISDSLSRLILCRGSPIFCTRIWDWLQVSSVFSIVALFLYRRTHAHSSSTRRACVLYFVPVWVQTNGELIRSKEPIFWRLCESRSVERWSVIL